MSEIAHLLAKIRLSKKYRYICADTIRDLFEKELVRCGDANTAVKAMRKRLHQVAAFYLGDPDYARATREIDLAIHHGDQGEFENTCLRIMGCHTSTRERLPGIRDFYNGIFSVTGKPCTIMDIACGLNPLAFPFMGLPLSTVYHAYDIHAERVEFLNRYFANLGLEPQAVLQDVIFRPPQIKADIAFLFKMAHCFERREKGCTLPLLEALDVPWLAVSFPARNLPGTSRLEDIYRRLFYRIITNKPWQVKELVFNTEVVFCVKKSTVE